MKPPYVGTKNWLWNADGQILGVVKDFNFKSLKDPVAPLIIRTSGFKNILYVRTTVQAHRQPLKPQNQSIKKYADNAPSFTILLIRRSIALSIAQRHALCLQLCSDSYFYFMPRVLAYLLTAL